MMMLPVAAPERPAACTHGNKYRSCFEIHIFQYLNTKKSECGQHQRQQHTMYGAGEGSTDTNSIPFTSVCGRRFSFAHKHGIDEPQR